MDLETFRLEGGKTLQSGARPELCSRTHVFRAMYRGHELGPNPILCIVLLSLGLGVRLNWMKLPFGMFGYQVELRRQILEVMDLAGHPF